jgi:VIT1/CCC1 family predicted Fe2+/Mn2+ transporter
MNDNLSSFIYGGSDGVITTIALISGSIGMKAKKSTIVTITIAKIIADGLSMAFGAYESHLGEDNIKVAFITFISFVVLGMIPLYIYWISSDRNKEKLTYISVLVVLFGIGYIKAHYMNNNSKITTGIKTMALGGIVSYISYSIAKYIDY